MTTTISIYVENLEEVMALYNTIYVYRGTSPYATFTRQSGMDTTLVEDETLYEIEDPTGDASYFYRYTFFNTSTLSESGYSTIQHPDTTTLNRLRMEAAIMSGGGFESVTTATSPNGTHLVDATLVDNGSTVKFLEGVWIYRPTSTVIAGDKCRRMALNGYNENDQIQISRGWTNFPAAGETYQAFMYLPPIRQAGASVSWQDIVNDALRAVHIQDLIVIGTGTTTRQMEFDLAPWSAVITRRNIRRVWLRRSDSNGNFEYRDADKLGRFWNIVMNPPAMMLKMFPAPSSTETIVVEVNRSYGPLYNDLEVTDCPFELAVRAVKWKLFERLNKLQAGKYATESALARGEFMDEYYSHKPEDVVRL